jgi:hypothetical protein
MKMRPFRRLIVAGIASVTLLTVAIGEAASQTIGQPGPETPAEMARSIALAIDTKTPKWPDAPIKLVSAASRDNVVEVHYVTNEPRLFPHTDAEREERRLRLANYFCFNTHISLFKKPGVVIHQIFTYIDNSAPFEFIVDESSCAALIADAKTRAAGFNQFKSLDEPKPVPTIKIRPDQVDRQ